MILLLATRLNDICNAIMLNDCERALTFIARILMLIALS